MTYPTQEEVAHCNPILPWIDEHFLRMDPFAFKDTDFRKFVFFVAKELNVDPNGIYCIGSGAIGLSLDPDKMIDRKLKAFTTGSDTEKASDIDLAIVSEVHFESAWRDLRVAAQPTLDSIDKGFEKAISWQKKRFFDGAIITNALLPYLSTFGREWLEASVRIEEWVVRAFEREVDVNFWIYRDYWSVRNYVASGLVKCRRKIGA